MLHLHFFQPNVLHAFFQHISSKIWQFFQTRTDRFPFAGPQKPSSDWDSFPDVVVVVIVVLVVVFTVIVIVCASRPKIRKWEWIPFLILFVHPPPRDEKFRFVDVLLLLALLLLLRLRLLLRLVFTKTVAPVIVRIAPGTLAAKRGEKTA
jgi:hypothetical protein